MRLHKLLGGLLLLVLSLNANAAGWVKQEGLFVLETQSQSVRYRRLVDDELKAIQTIKDPSKCVQNLNYICSDFWGVVYYLPKNEALDCQFVRVGEGLVQMFDGTILVNGVEACPNKPTN